MRCLLTGEIRAIGEDELARMGFSAEMFRNLNTPEDWQRAQMEFGRQQGELSGEAFRRLKRES